MRKGRIFIYMNPFKFYRTLPMRVIWDTRDKDCDEVIATLKPLPNDIILHEGSSYSIVERKIGKGIVYIDNNGVPTIVHGQMAYSKISIDNTKAFPNHFYSVNFPIKQDTSSDAFQVAIIDEFKQSSNLMREMEMIKWFYDLPDGTPEASTSEGNEYQKVFEEAVQGRLIDVQSDTSIDTFPVTSDRYNLTDRIIFTVDSETTKDIDDAIEVKQLTDKTYLFGIHIADVTEFIKAASHRDRDAESRGTSHYLADKVIHMLPAILSEQYCSLNENKNRLAISVYAEIEDTGSDFKIKGIRFMKSMIRSKAKLSYNMVEDVLSQQMEARGIDQSIVSSLLVAKKLADIIEANTPYKDISYGTGNIKYFEETGGKINRKKDNSRSSDKLIEMFMVTANRLVGEKIADMIISTHKEPTGIGAFRIQAVPKEKDLQEYLAKLKKAGLADSKASYDALKKESEDLLKEKKEIKCLSDTEKNDLVLSLIYRKICQGIKVDDEDNRIKMGVLSRFGYRGGRIMTKASLSDNFEKSFHLSIGISRYTWFTSPIRRYADIINHRVLKGIISKEEASSNRTDITALSQKVKNADYAEDNFHKRLLMYYLCDQHDLCSAKELIIKVTSFQWTAPSIVRIEGLWKGQYNLIFVFKKTASLADVGNDGLSFKINGMPCHVGDVIEIAVENIIPQMGYIQIADQQISTKRRDKGKCQQ